MPWAFDDEAVGITRKFTKLRMRLMPYLLGAADQVVAHGTPMIRPMAMEFPEDPATDYLSTQYMVQHSKCRPSGSPVSG